MKSLVLYESMYGNTHLIAKAIGSALSEAGETVVMPLYQAKQMAIVHACGSGDQTRSHFEAMATVERIQSATPANVRPVARLGTRSLPFIPAQSVRRGMVMDCVLGSISTAASCRAASTRAGKASAESRH